MTKDESSTNKRNKLCPKCKAKLKGNEKKCPSCGKKIDVEITKEQVKKKKKTVEHKTIKNLKKDKNESKKVVNENIKNETHVNNVQPVENVNSDVMDGNNEQLTSEMKSVNHDYNLENEIVSVDKNADLEKTIAIINVETAAKEGYRDYAEQISFKSNKNKEKRLKVILICIIIFLLLVCVIQSILLFRKSEEDYNNKASRDTLVKKASIQMNIYYSNNKFLTEKTSRSVFLGTIKTVDQNIELFDGLILYNDYNNYDGAIVLYRDDNKIKLYNTKSDEETILNISSNYDKYNIISDKNNKVYGVGYLEDANTTVNRFGSEIIDSFQSSGYYNIEKEKVMYSGKGLYNFEYVSSSKIKANRGINNAKQLVLLDQNYEKEYLYNDLDDSICGTVDYQSLNDNYILIGKPNCVDDRLNNVSIYNKDMLRIIDNVKYYLNFKIYNGYLYVSKDNIIYKFDENGKIKYNSDPYDQVLDIINDYFVVIDNGILKIITENKMSVTIDNWSDNYTYDLSSSGYFDERDFKNDSSNNEGIYITIITDENGTNTTRYYYNPITREVSKMN